MKELQDKNLQRDCQLYENIAPSFQLGLSGSELPNNRDPPLLSYQYGMGDSKNTSLIVVVSSLTVFVFWLEWTHGKLQR